ncbi:hypothetical protein HJG60_009358 [Phyllostomus discolor]|uniref:Uncharacterized protein n=1 Tax=Phyllostomus discolor TaxID=89673 RepID=A0A833YJK0_9CHIR|nr:hypothetical protein HJG60_009358 [Phyllostomus discolor]
MPCLQMKQAKNLKSGPRCTDESLLAVQRGGAKAASRAERQSCRKGCFCFVLVCFGFCTKATASDPAMCWWSVSTQKRYLFRTSALQAEADAVGWGDSMLEEPKEEFTRIMNGGEASTIIPQVEPTVFKDRRLRVCSPAP